MIRIAWLVAAFAIAAFAQEGHEPPKSQESASTLPQPTSLAGTRLAGTGKGPELSGSGPTLPFWRAGLVT